MRRERSVAAGGRSSPSDVVLLDGWRRRHRWLRLEPDRVWFLEEHRHGLLALAVAHPAERLADTVRAKHRLQAEADPLVLDVLVHRDYDVEMTWLAAR